MFTYRHPDLPYLKHLGSLLSAEWPLGADIFQEPFAHHEHTFLLGKQYGKLDTIKLSSSHIGNSISESPIFLYQHVLIEGPGCISQSR